eukprot:gnl/TRDRNA2_/TRDRNA2_177385_c0_seq6.p1 gnl/TRDRNA2_/TRDRNA2_177385_c0~~gnl/TRDRNA2_/TRDRNA2_177385_c0_seq6.p1  ORF type:complete len:211 (-),score=21.91 gnl/TRDRNA2_/TRDRNA2_177385_c0_seq6:4-636(-)
MVAAAVRGWSPVRSGSPHGYAWSTQDLANVVQAPWTAERRWDERLCSAVVAEEFTKTHEFRPMELAGTAWAFSTLAYTHSPLLEALSVSSMKNCMGPRELANTAWSMARLQFTHKPLLDAIAYQSLPRMQRCTTNWSTQALANTSWSLAVLPCCQIPASPARAAAQTNRIKSSRVQEPANLVQLSAATSFNAGSAQWLSHRCAGLRRRQT